MSASKLSLLEMRMEALEAEVARLKQRTGVHTEQKGEPKQDWVKLIFGAFADYPGYDKVIELGRKYRESLRPTPSRKTTRKKTTRKKANRKAAKKRGQ
ncbi:MAG: hypothetical protein ACREAB_18555 [Blastocatellia bacterium]